MPKKEGFIVHPFETDSGKYHASYGPNHNKTVKDFKTLKAAKTYLKKKQVKRAMYDSPSGAKYIDLSKKGKSIKKKKRPYNALFDLRI